MKTKIIFLGIIIAAICVGMAKAQITPSIQKVSLTESDKAILEQRISKYTVFTIDNKELAVNLYSSGGGQFRLRVDETTTHSINELSYQIINEK